jgi:uncharacterized protein involved in response to NO
MTVLARGFRPFFLLGATWAVVAIALWVAILRGVVGAPAWGTPIAWHGHEMLFGFASAAIAGFLTTAVPVWTGTAPRTGGALAALVALWLAGRGAMLAAGALPGPVVAAIELAFLPALALAIGLPIIRARRRRDLLFPAVLLALAACDGALHADALGLAPGAAAPGLRGAVSGVALLVVVLGGRLVPSFTSNALARAGLALGAETPAWARRAAVPAFLVYAAADLLAPGTAWSGLAAAAAAAVLLARMRRWRALAVWRDPLLASLHLGHAWVPIGLAMLAAADLASAWPRSVAIHALTAGAFGTMILAVMTRVALGHTGRPLVAPPAAVAAYALVTLGAVLRTAGVALLPDPGAVTILVAGALWAGAYAVFVAGYARILLSPRVDGGPG